MEKFANIPYVRPDLEAYKAALPAYVESIRNATSWEDLKAKWLEQSAKKLEIMTMRSIASIRNTVNTLDPYYEAEMRYFHTNMPEINLIEKQAEAALLEGPYVADFEKEFGSILITNMKNAQKLADARLIPLQIKESELTSAYSKASANCVTEFRGQKANFYVLLKAMQSTDRKTRREAFVAWADLYKQVSPELDRIYDELVALRDEMAKTLGFNNHTEMAYLQRRRFDYTAADAANFRKQVKEVITPACAKLFDEQRQRLGVDKLHWYDESLVFPEGNADPEGTKDEMVATAQQMYRELSPETGEFFDFMVEHDLFDLETKPGKRPGGYCTSLPSYKAPFIFSNFNGTNADVGVLTHEAGHAFQAFVSSRCMPLADMAHSTSEINEIHSMAMEHFTYPWMDRFFGDKTPKYLYDHLWGALNVLPYMCCVDEFQHEVYNNPTMTAADRRAVWHKLETEYMPWRDYDGNEFLEEGGFWMQKQHIFLYPFYYIEYALAQIGAFEFYLKMKKDLPSAWADYLRLCKAGGSVGYFDLLKLANLNNPFHEGTVEKAVSAVLESIEELKAQL